MDMVSAILWAVAIGALYGAGISVASDCAVGEPWYRGLLWWRGGKG